VACNGEAVIVECYDGDTIRVVNANYGRRDTVTCPDDHADNVECVHNETLKTVHDRCAAYSSPVAHPGISF